MNINAKAPAMNTNVGIIVKILESNSDADFISIRNLLLIFIRKSIIALVQNLPLEFLCLTLSSIFSQNQVLKCMVVLI